MPLDDDQAEASDDSRADLTRRRSPRRRRRSRTSAILSSQFLWSWLLLLAWVPLLEASFEPSTELLRRVREAVDDYSKQTGTRNDGSAAERLITRGAQPAFADRFPDRRIPGAHLPFGSNAHYGYAAAAFFVFVTLGMLVFRLQSTSWRIFFRSASIGAGICFLIVAGLTILQGVAMDAYVNRQYGILFFVGYVLKFIYLPNQMINDTKADVWITFLAYTLGVAFYEEFIKLIPTAAYMDRSNRSWRRASAAGFAAGLGFGIVEACMYAGRLNGIADRNFYLLRFTSLIGLHALCGAISSLTFWLRRDQYHIHVPWNEWTLGALKALPASMFLHGLHNTLVRQGYGSYAMLAVGVAGTLWFALLTNAAVRQEGRYHDG